MPREDKDLLEDFVQIRTERRRSNEEDEFPGKGQSVASRRLEAAKSRQRALEAKAGKALRALSDKTLPTHASSEQTPVAPANESLQVQVQDSAREPAEWCNGRIMVVPTKKSSGERDRRRSFQMPEDQKIEPPRLKVESRVKAPRRRSLLSGRAGHKNSSEACRRIVQQSMMTTSQPPPSRDNKPKKERQKIRYTKSAASSGTYTTASSSHLSSSVEMSVPSPPQFSKPQLSLRSRKLLATYLESRGHTEEKASQMAREFEDFVRLKEGPIVNEEPSCASIPENYSQKEENEVGCYQDDDVSELSDDASYQDLFSDMMYEFESQRDLFAEDTRRPKQKA